MGSETLNVGQSKFSYLLNHRINVFVIILEINEGFGNYCHGKFFHWNSPLHLNKKPLNWRQSFVRVQLA